METRRKSLLLVLAVLCVAITTLTSFSLRRDKMLLRTVLQEVAELRAELESRDKTVSELQAKVEESFQRLLGQTPPPSADSFAELARRFDQLTTQQNKTLALVQSLASTGAQDESPVLRQQRRQLGIGSLEDKLKTEQESLDAAKQKADQLATI